MATRARSLTPSVVAIVTATNAADSVGATVGLLRRVPSVTRVLVVDDGSTDATTERARAAGADVLRLPRTVGSGGGVGAGVGAAPDAAIYVLVGAGPTPAPAWVEALLAPVLAGEADMAMGVMRAGRARRGVLGRLAVAGIRRASGHRVGAPAAGHLAVRGPLLRSVGLADHSGFETALTIDAVRAGARVVEVAIDEGDRNPGPRVTPLRRLPAEAVGLVRALWPRLTSPARRAVAIVAVFAVLTTWVVWSGGRWAPASEPLAARPTKVVLFGVPHYGLDDLGSGATPTLNRMVAQGAVAAMTVRTLSAHPTSTEGYASLGAGTRVRATNASAAAYAGDAIVENGPARDVVERRTGRPAPGEVVVVGYPQAVRLVSGKHLSSEPGALGDALHAAGLRTAVVGNADAPGSHEPRVAQVSRPIAMALVDRAGSIDIGRVDQGLLRPDPTAPYGFSANPEAVVTATAAALRRADVVAVDPGDLDRAFDYRTLALDRAAQTARRAALRSTDAILGRVWDALPRGTLLLVVSVAPPTGRWHLTPMVAVGPGVPHGWAHSSSVKRRGVVTLTDLAPTVLSALHAPLPEGMIGHALRYHRGSPDLEYLRRLDRDANYREGTYFPVTVTYIIVQALLYVFAMLALGRGHGASGIERFLRCAVTAVAAFPLATFLFRAIPNVATLGGGGIVVLLAVDAAITTVAVRARRHPLSPLAWIVWATVTLIVADLAVGGRLQYSSLLGYSLHTAARFFGLGNTAFAVFAASALIAACIHVEYAPRRRDALLVVSGMLGLVLLVDGAPTLGDDIGGILTLVPVFGLTLVALWGRRISWRTVCLVLGGLVLLVGAAAGLDLLRGPDARTHLGRFVADLFNGHGDQSVTTIARKAGTNVRLLGASIWTWMVPIAAVFTLFLLVYLDRGAELVPRGSARRIGVVAALAAGLLGCALNDSGVVVTALVALYIGPYLTLLALHADRGGPVLHLAATPLVGAGAPDGTTALKL